MQKLLRRMEYYPLAVDVLAVAVEGTILDWSAYIKAVKGWNHEEEMKEVAEHGNKLPYKIAKILFPSFDSQFSWRD